MLLVISPVQEDHIFIQNALRDQEIPVLGVSTAREGLALLRHRPARLVIAEKELPDGDWKHLLTALAEMSCPPLLIVASRQADDCLGGYDVLAKPFSREELSRVAQQAYAHHARIPAPPGILTPAWT
jgi:DNA-binding response OmpR family regulator